MKKTVSNGNQPLTKKEQEQTIKDVEKAYEKVMDALKIDWKKDPNSKDTPRRVAKSLVLELFSGRFEQEPKVTQFPNDGYTGIVFQGNIDVVSCCSHHHNPFVGKAYVAYIPKSNGKVIGLSKINRIVEWYSRRPQIQESLTQQIFEKFKTLIDNDGVAVLVEAKHMCCSSRGVKHDSTMKTALVSGLFLKNQDGCKDEFYKFVEQLKK